MPSYIITETDITVIVNGKSFSVKRGNAQANTILDELRKKQPNETRLLSLLNTATALALYSDSEIEVRKDGSVFRFGKALPDVLAKKVLTCFNDGVPYKHLVNLFLRLEANPSKRAIDELYPFLAHGHMAITEKGFFLGYKGVANDYMDIHSHKFSNKPGNVLYMKRNEVCDDADQGCSYGFHVGSYEYARDWAGSGGHVVIVEVDPADVVSSPKDCSFQTLRTCRYRVICEAQGLLTDGGVADTDRPYASAFTSAQPPVDDGILITVSYDDEDVVLPVKKCTKKCTKKAVKKPDYSVAFNAGVKRAEGLVKKGIFVEDLKAFFSNDARRKIRIAYGNTEAALSAYLRGFESIMDD